MAERSGYIYRRAGAGAAELRELLGRPARGWGWTPAAMYDAARGHDLSQGHEGRACREGLEIRWRQEPSDTKEQRYDLLVLALEPQDLPGFAALPADGMPWQVEATTIRLQHPAATAGVQDEPLNATAFIAPDGSVQFVALIERSEP